MPRLTKSHYSWLLIFLIAVLGSGVLFAQYQQEPPEFGDSYTLPTPTHPEPRAAWIRTLDIIMLIVGLALGAWLALKRRSRNGVIALSIGAIAYFGFYRKGCICPIGSIQNVALSLADPQYMISMGVIVFFFLPLAAALLFGRVFCGGVCPFGAIQDLVLLWPKKVSQKLDMALGWLPYIYLGLALLFAVWGFYLKIGEFQIQLDRRFLICEWDPFIGIFRISGSFHMLLIGACFILAGMFIGRPYCRWLCPYGKILSILSRFAWKNVELKPNKERECSLFDSACPYGAIQNSQVDRGQCLSCARCFEYCQGVPELRSSSSGDELVKVKLS